MKIAIPLTEGKVSMHFGHCEHFALLDVSDSTREITATTMHTPPQHEPGVLPRWLHELGASLVIAGGIGRRAVGLFEQADIQVVPGAPMLAPQDVVHAYLNGTLQTGRNYCDH